MSQNVLIRLHGVACILGGMFLAAFALVVGQFSACCRHIRSAHCPGGPWCSAAFYTVPR
jgi:hypothetical protein